MSVALPVYLAAASLLWLSVFGYLLILVLVTIRRRILAAEVDAKPRIAVVVPTLNEASLISAKLDDVGRCDYPDDRLKIYVVDGGSTDGTVARVRQALTTGRVDRLLRVDGRGGKAQQINRALQAVDEDIIVFTDADACLEPICIRELVKVLVQDPSTAVVGARIQPRSQLLEERIHWWFLNNLWWLEGEALSTAVVSGVCYAVRRHAILPLVADASSEDAHIALRTGATGLRVRLCRAARATELRVPQTTREMLAFRRRRGAVYVRELSRPSHDPALPWCWCVARFARLWHVRVTPVLGAAVALGTAGLLLTPSWTWALVSVAAFCAPTWVAVSASRTLSGAGWWRRLVATARLVGLWWLSLVALGDLREGTLVSGNAR